MKKTLLFLAALAVVGLSACSTAPSHGVSAMQSTEHNTPDDNSPMTYLHNPNTD